MEFKHGFIEKLGVLGFADNSVDVMISNCVICLTAVKEDVFREIARVLKPGGEIYFRSGWNYIFLDHYLLL